MAGGRQVAARLPPGGSHQSVGRPSRLPACGAAVCRCSAGAVQCRPPATTRPAVPSLAVFAAAGPAWRRRGRGAHLGSAGPGGMPVLQGHEPGGPRRPGHTARGHQHLCYARRHGCRGCRCRGCRCRHGGGGAGRGGAGGGSQPSRSARGACCAGRQRHPEQRGAALARQPRRRWSAAASLPLHCLTQHFPSMIAFT